MVYAPYPVQCMCQLSKAEQKFPKGPKIQEKSFLSVSASPDGPRKSFYNFRSLFFPTFKNEVKIPMIVPFLKIWKRFPTI